MGKPNVYCTTKERGKGVSFYGTVFIRKEAEISRQNMVTFFGFML